MRYGGSTEVILGVNSPGIKEAVGSRCIPIPDAGIELAAAAISPAATVDGSPSPSHYLPLLQIRAHLVPPEYTPFL
jgi:hypothetical protein